MHANDWIHSLLNHDGASSKGRVFFFPDSAKFISIIKSKFKISTTHTFLTSSMHNFFSSRQSQPFQNLLPGILSRDRPIKSPDTRVLLSSLSPFFILMQNATTGCTNVHHALHVANVVSFNMLLCYCFTFLFRDSSFALTSPSCFVSILSIGLIDSSGAGSDLI